MNKSLDKVKWLSLIAGILLIVVAFVNMMYPEEFTLELVKFLGIALVALGIIRVVRYFNKSVFSTGSFLVGGIVDIILGFLILKYKVTSLKVLFLLLGFWVLSNGVFQIAISIDFKKIGVKGWWLDLLSGILGIIVGIMLLGNFDLSMLYVTLLISGYALLLGISFIFTFFGIGKFNN